jgi:large subunit ribosomal protein L24e
VHSSKTGQSCALVVISTLVLTVRRMAVAREKHRAHRQKKMQTAVPSIKLHEPMAVETAGPSKIQEKIKVPAKKSALIQGEGRSMGMDVD